MISLREVIELLRRGSDADAAVALKRIREAEDVDEAVEVLALAAALVAPTASGSGTYPGSQHDEDAGTDRPRRSSQLSSCSS